MSGYRVTFEAKIEHTTPKAYLVEPIIGEQCWVPKSQVESKGEPDEDGNVVFVVSEWWASKQEWLREE